MKMNKKLLSMAIGTTLAATSQTTLAALPVKAQLDFDAGAKVCTIGPDAGTSTGCAYDVTETVGSNFSMDQSGDGVVQEHERVLISQNDGIKLGTIQGASGSHTFAPDGTESPGIDNPWNFFGNTGMHQTTSAVTVLSDDGAGTVGLDFSGWNVTWNGIASIPMGGDSANFASDTGIAIMTCAVDCGDGDTYVLDYAAHVPLGDESGFGGVPYALHLEGTVSAVPVPAAVWLFGSGLLGLVGVARRKKQA